MCRENEQNVRLILVPAQNFWDLCNGLQSVIVAPI